MGIDGTLLLPYYINMTASPHIRTSLHAGPDGTSAPHHMIPDEAGNGMTVSLCML